MNSQKIKGTLVISAAWLALQPHPCFASPPPYSLSTVPPGLATPFPDYWASDINDVGQIAITQIDATHYYNPFRVDPDGTIHPAGPHGSQSLIALDDGRVLSVGGPNPYQVGIDGNYVPVIAPAGTSPDSYNVYAASSDGTLIGTANGNLTKWSATTFSPTVIGQFNDQSTYGFGISSNGKYVVGRAGTNMGGQPGGSDGMGVTMPFIYSNGSFTSINVPGFDFAEAVSVNNSGVVIGNAIGWAQFEGFVLGYTEGFVWKNGVTTFLSDEPFGLDSGSQAIDINNAGTILGYIKGVTTGWFDGVPVDLETLAVPTFPSGAGLQDTAAINDADQVIGDIGFFDNGGSALQIYLLTPIPEPGTAMYAILLAVLPVRRTSRV